MYILNSWNSYLPCFSDGVKTALHSTKDEEDTFRDSFQALDESLGPRGQAFARLPSQGISHGDIPCDIPLDSPFNS